MFRQHQIRRASAIDLRARRDHYHSIIAFNFLLNRFKQQISGTRINLLFYNNQVSAFVSRPAAFFFFPFAVLAAVKKILHLFF